MNAQKLFTAAINLKLCTAGNLVAYGAVHGTDIAGCAAILADLDEVAESLQHCNPAKRASWIAVRDASRFFERDATRGEMADRFGFRRDARAEAAAAFAAAGISP